MSSEIEEIEKDSIIAYGAVGLAMIVTALLCLFLVSSDAKADSRKQLVDCHVANEYTDSYSQCVKEQARFNKYNQEYSE